MGSGTTKSLRQVVFQCNSRVCKMCGAADGDFWQTIPKRPVRLTTGYIVPIGMGGKKEKANVRMLCDECSEGLIGVEYISRPSAQELIKMVGRATHAIQREVAGILLEKCELMSYTCQMCGAAAGDPDPFSAGRTVRLTMGHIIDKSKGGKDTQENLRAVCTNCNEGLQNTALPKPSRIHLLAQVRRATIDDQQALLEWLLQKFGLAAKKKS